MNDSASTLFLVFVVLLILKLTGTVAWSWWVITLPLWIAPVFYIGIIAISLIIMLFCFILIKACDSKGANDFYRYLERKLRK